MLSYSKCLNMLAMITTIKDSTTSMLIEHLFWIGTEDKEIVKHRHYLGINAV